MAKHLYYFIKGQVKGRKRRKKKAQKMMATVAETTGSADALATVLKIKALANSLGGIKKPIILCPALFAL